ncbi:MAG: enolase C-terminal domain-like protein [Pseudomonadota bacterium]
MPSDSLPCIADVTARTVRVPMAEPHQTASGVITESPLVLIDITTDTGTVGHSLVFTYTPAALKPTADLIANLAPLVTGELLAPTEIELGLAKRFRLLGTQGLVGMALAGIDMALWDALAREQGVSLVRLLGGVIKPIPAYGAIGYDGEVGSGRVAEALAKQGFTGVKAKIGYPTAAEDVAVVRAIRAAAGDGMAIMVDYNQSLSPIEAAARVRVLGGEGLTWIEEPTLAHDFAGQARVTAGATTPIQSGENLWGTLDLRHAIEANASDFLMPDVMKIGGVTGWQRAAAMAHAQGIPVSNHLWPELSARLLCCTPTAHWLEYADWWNPILAEPLLLEDGMACVDDGVGTGVSWNERAIGDFLA